MFKKTIAIQGLFRSGTNYTKSLIELNYSCNTSFTVFGWKHSFIPELSDNKHNAHSLCILVTKNPYSFVHSLHKYFINEKMNIDAPTDFKEFMRSRITIYNEQNRNSQKFRFRNPVEMWNQLNFNFLNNPTSKHIQYETLIQDPQKVITSSLAGLQIKRKTQQNEFLIPQKEVLRFGNQNMGKDIGSFEGISNFDRSQYVDHGYMSNYEDDDIGFIKNEIDATLLAELGYIEMIEALTAHLEVEVAK